MPSINEVMERVDRVTPNTIEQQDKARWLMELDGRVYAEVTQADAPNTLPPQSWPEDGDKPLLVEAPRDNIYDLYLIAMVQFYMREYSDYNNTVDQFTKAYNEFLAWYRRNHVPRQTAQLKL